MFCSSCGKQLPEGAKFCNSCGKKVVIPNAVVDNRVVTPNEAVNQRVVSKTPMNRKRILIVVALVVAVVMIGIAVYAYVTRRKSIDLNSYVEAEFSGVDGNGTCELSVDWDQVFEDYPDLDYSEEALKASNSLIGILSAKDVMDESYDVDTEDDTDLSNGDKVKYVWNVYSNEKYFTYDFLYSDGQIEVSGLEAKASETKSATNKSNQEKKEESKKDNEEEVSSSDYICPDSMTRKLTDQDITSYMSQDWSNKKFPGDRTVVQMMINEIYAQKGYQFSDEELTNYFNQYDWYTSITDKTNDMDAIYQGLSDVERSNVDLLNTYK